VIGGRRVYKMVWSVSEIVRAWLCACAGAREIEGNLW
jgi:hypothetical protein